jgi:hypothetical protein
LQVFGFSFCWNSSKAEKLYDTSEKDRAETLLEGEPVFCLKQKLAQKNLENRFILKGKLDFAKSKTLRQIKLKSAEFFFSLE